MPASDRRTPRKVDVRPPLNPLPSYVGLGLAAVAAYLVAESALAARPHPLHWAAALTGGLIGWGVGYAVAWAINR